MCFVDKCAVTLKLTQGLLKQKRKVVIFTKQRKTVVFVANALNAAGIKTIQIDGNVATNDREALFNKFRNNIDVLVCTSGTCKEGLNLEMASAAIITELDFNPFVDWQCAGR